MNTTNTTQDVTTQEGVWVEIARITVPEDARQHTPEDIDSRALSLAKEGQLENILLSKEGDQLVLVYGNGRLESAKKAGWEKIRADIKEGLSESQKLMMTLAENEAREDASPFYTAGLYHRLMEAKGLTQDQLADELGKARQLVQKYSSLLTVVPEVRENANALALSLRQCLAIAKLTKPEDQLKVMEECATQDLSGKALEARVKQLLGKPVETKAAVPKAAVPGFHFSWKGHRLTVRGTWEAAGKGSATLSLELQTALSEFLENHPLQEVAQAA